MLTVSDFVDSLLARRDSVLTPDLIRSHLKIMDKQAHITPFVPNKVQLDFRRNKARFNLVLKPRQVGLSTEIQADDFVAAITSTALCATLAHDSEATAKMRRMASRFYENLPDSIRPIRGLDNATTTTYPATGSEVTIVTAGSGNAGRGGTYNRVHGSEVAFWKNPELIMAGIVQGMTPDGIIVLESSANGASGYFYDRCMEAMRGNSIWKLHFYTWWWADEYRIPLSEPLIYTEEEQMLVNKHGLDAEQINWRRYKQLELGDLFLQEYPEDPETCFLVSGRGVFQLDNKPNLFTDSVIDRSILGFPLHVADGYVADEKSVHVMAIDWGQSPDSSVASIWDATTYREIALYITGKRDYEHIIGDFVQLAKHYNVRYIVPEKNSMRMQISFLAKGIQEAMADAPPRITPFNMDNRRKDDLVKLFQTGVNEGLRLLDNPIGKHELRIFEARQTPSGLWTYAAPVGDGNHDDTVITRMLGNLACYQLRDRLN